MAKLQNLKNVNGEYVYETWDAHDVYAASRDALEVAKAVGCTITMIFNAARVPVTGKEETADVVSENYFTECTRQEEAYANSPAGRAEAARWAARQANEQQIINTLVDGKLDDAIKHGIAGVIGWMAEYAAHADNSTIDRRNAEILGRLTAAGYKANAHVRDEKTDTDLRTNGLYIIGQCLACMESGMPPHGGFAAGYIRGYNEMKKTAFIPLMQPLTLNAVPRPPEPKPEPVSRTIKLKTGP